MVTRYDVISSRWFSHSRVKMHVFQLVSAIKPKPVDNIKQNTYFCFILHVYQAQKINDSLGFFDG